MPDTKISSLTAATPATACVFPTVETPGVGPVKRSMTAAGATIVEAANAAAQRTALGLATVAASGAITDLTGTMAAAQEPAHTGDVTNSAGSLALAIATGAVTDTKGSLANKPACMVVATANLTLSGEQTIDGQTTNTSLVLATAQSTGSQNGPWVTGAGAWTRPTWYPAGGTTQAFPFITTLIRLGTTYAGSVWRITSAGAVTIDTTSTTWAITIHAINSNTVNGTLPAAQLPALTGDVTSSAGSAATTLANIPAISGANLTTLNATNISSGTLNVARFPANELISTISLETQMNDGSTITTGSKRFVQVQFSGTITNWTVIGNTSGSIVFDIKRSTYAGFPTTTSIVGGGNKPTLSSVQNNTAATSGWTSTTITAGDIIEFNVDSVSTLTWAKVELQVTRT